MEIILYNIKIIQELIAQYSISKNNNFRNRIINSTFCLFILIINQEFCRFIQF